MSGSQSWSVRRVAPVVALLALVPAAVFLFVRGTPVVALALVNVVLIAGSVFVLLSTSESEARAGAGTH
ncbi:MAG: cytochrome-ba3 oxidase subunit [Haloferacaceae archaeon]